jgi:hypothetical protein
MADQRWDRYAAGTGLGAAVLLAVQAFLAPLYPTFSDSTITVVRYYHTNGSAIRVQILFTGLAGVLFLWFLGSLRTYLRGFEGDLGRISAIAFGAGLAATGPAAVGALVTAAAARAVSGAGFATPFQQFIEPGAVAPLHQLRLLSYPLTWFAFAPLLAATAVVAARTGAFPRWHMNASYVISVLSLGAGLSILIDTGAFAPGGPYNLMLFTLFLVWLGVTSWLIMQSFAPTMATTTPTADTETLPATPAPKEPTQATDPPTTGPEMPPVSDAPPP